MDMKEFNTIVKAEHVLSALQLELNSLQEREALAEENEALNKLVVENTKLKHRLSILNKASQMSSGNVSVEGDVIAIINYLTSVLQQAVTQAFPTTSDLPNVVTASANPKFGDYQFNSCMSIAQKLKPEKISPMEIATKVMQFLRPCNVVLKYELSKPGYINIFLNKLYANTAVKSLLKNGVKPPVTRKQRVIVDFSSPNIAKEMHVGHLRSTIIGESIARLLEFYGHDVLRLNHIGDWGTQFGMLIAHLQDKFPRYLEVAPPLNDLQAFYKESKVRFDEDEVFKKRAYSAVVKLQSNDPDHKKAWNIICDVSRKAFQNIYDRLGVTIIERGESFYQPLMEAIVKELNSLGVLEEDEGRKIMWGTTPNKGIPLTIEKSGGGFTYDTSDMAAIKHRLEVEKADWVIYVVDAGQATHFLTIFDCATRVGIIDPAKHRIDHVGFGLVLGEDGKKFKSRSGDTVKLSDLLNEGLKRSMSRLEEKGRHEVLTQEELKAAQESIAYGCIKYSDLSHNRNLDYTFSFDKMLDDKGNTAVYLLYALTRIKSIARNCGEDFLAALPKYLESVDFKFDHEKEWKLAKMILKFPDVLNEICKDLLMHRLCEYVYDLSAIFTEFYSSCYCIEKNKEGQIVKINHERVLLAEATAIVLDKCFNILGLSPLEKI